MAAKLQNVWLIQTIPKANLLQNFFLVVLYLVQSYWFSPFFLRLIQVLPPFPSKVYFFWSIGCPVSDCPVLFPIPSPGDLPVSPPFSDNNRERTVIRTFILDSIIPGIYFQSAILIEFVPWNLFQWICFWKTVPLPFIHCPSSMARAMSRNCRTK